MYIESASPERPTKIKTNNGARLQMYNYAHQIIDVKRVEEVDSDDGFGETADPEDEYTFLVVFRKSQLSTNKERRWCKLNKCIPDVPTRIRMLKEYRTTLDDMCLEHMTMHLSCKHTFLNRY
jgi:hypothetical protein